MMSRFDLEKTNKEPEEWGQVALQRVGNNGLQSYVFGGFALAATVAVMSNPLTGALVAGYVLWSAVEKGRNQQKNFEAVRNGCIAHVLEEGEFRAYARQVGHETVMRELKYATEEEYELSNAALDYLEQQAPQLAHNKPLISSFGQTPLTLPGFNREHAPVLSQSDSLSAGIPDMSIDIVKEMTDPIQNCVIFGLGGTGKGMLIANGMRRIKLTRPNCKIFYIDPKDYQPEHKYTEGVADINRRKACKSRPEKEICDWVDECIDEYLEWSAKQEETLLVIDEGTILGDAAKKCSHTRVGTHILHVASLGGAAKEKVWLLAQSPFVKPMGLDLSTATQLTNICIVSENNVSVLKGWKRSSLIEIATPEELRELLKACTIPVTKRAIFWGGTSKWYAMPPLENYSDYDRDSDKPVGDALTTNERQELRHATATTAVQVPPTPKTDSTEQLINKLQRSRQTSLEDFISKDLKAPTRIAELRSAIVDMLREKKRTDLLEAFGLGWLAINDPVSALKHYAMGKDLNLEEIKEAWHLHTKQQLNDQGAQLLKEKLNNKEN